MTHIFISDVGPGSMLYLPHFFRVKVMQNVFSRTYWLFSGHWKHWKKTWNMWSRCFELHDFRTYTFWMENIHQINIWIMCVPIRTFTVRLYYLIMQTLIIKPFISPNIKLRMSTCIFYVLDALNKLRSVVNCLTYIFHGITVIYNTITWASVYLPHPVHLNDFLPKSSSQCHVYDSLSPPA